MAIKSLPPVDSVRIIVEVNHGNNNKRISKELRNPKSITVYGVDQNECCDLIAKLIAKNRHFDKFIELVEYLRNDISLLDENITFEND